MRPSTLAQDDQIIRSYLYDRIPPKIIVRILNLTSVHVVYEALRRGKMRGIIPPIPKIPQNSPTTKIKKSR
jgi:hypothetical protein